MSATHPRLGAVAQTFRSADGAADIYVLDDGRAVRAGVTGSMLLTGVGGELVRFLDDVDVR